MRELLNAIVRSLNGGQPAVLVSILRSEGSTPRGAGAMMAVFPGGACAGTIGGGSLEFEAQKTAVGLLSSGQNLMQSFRFTGSDAASLGMVCGGGVTLHFQYLPPDGSVAPLFQALLDADARGEDAWLLRRLDGDKVADMHLADRNSTPEAGRLLKSQPVLTPDGWSSIPVVRAGRVYLFGGGHVSQALVKVIAAVGFRPIVYDDRAEFSNASLFPQAEQTLCGPFESLSERISITSDDYVVVMTRGHQADTEVLSQVLRSGAKYIGCIGSRKKLEFCRQALLSQGFTESEYAFVHAPIGLAIGARTPEEIAVSVAAELIAVRAGVPEPFRQ